MKGVCQAPGINGNSGSGKTQGGQALKLTAPMHDLWKPGRTVRGRNNAYFIRREEKSKK
jgi:hypothetical protein